MKLSVIQQKNTINLVRHIRKVLRNVISQQKITKMYLSLMHKLVHEKCGPGAGCIHFHVSWSPWGAGCMRFHVSWSLCGATCARFQVPWRDYQQVAEREWRVFLKQENKVVDYQEGQLVGIKSKCC